MNATAEQIQASAAATWSEMNQAYLRLELQRLRMLFQRKLRWLRSKWQQYRAGPTPGAVISDANADWYLGGEEIEAEVRFYRENAESRALSYSIKEADAELAHLRSGLSESGGIPALEALCRTFGLQPFERDVLLLCWSMEEDPAFASLCAYVQDDVHARFPTPHLAFGLFCADGCDRETARHALLPASPLRRLRLLWLGDSSAVLPMCQRPLQIDERISAYLRGVNAVDESVAYLLRAVPAVPMADTHLRLIESLLQWVQSGGGNESWPVMWLTGPTGSGKQALAREFCARFELHLCALDPKSLPLQDAERHQLLHVIERETLLSRIAIYMDVSEVEPTDRGLMTAVRDWIERSGGLLFVGGRERWNMARSTLHIAVPKVDAAAQGILWRTSLQGVTNSVNGQVEAIVQQFDLGPQEIAQAVYAATAKARRRSAKDAAVEPDDLWQACREQVGWRLGDLAQRLEPCYRWEDIVLPEDVSRQLRELADQVAARPLVYEQWGFGARLPRGRGITALFSGPSGTGKTMAAEILAKQLNIDLYRIDLAGVVSKYIGETEKNLRNVFEAAEQTGAILLFDEADALFGKRSEVKDSHDRYANIEVNYLLQRMEDYRGLAILCTNRRSSLDRAFLRRLRFLVEFPFPDWSQRRLIWQKVFPRRTPLGTLDFEKLSRLEIPGGNIRNIALNAAFLAAGQNKDVEMEHVLHAARREYAKVDKLLTESEFGLHYREIKT
jgi:hypothetical protein